MLIVRNLNLINVQSWKYLELIPGFYSMSISTHQRYLFIHLPVGGERHCESKVSCQEHNTMSPSRVRTWSSRSEEGPTNHETTAPPSKRVV